jgi:hypothetical protein
MNETQIVFTVFFAISWGAVFTSLTRWKPFHYAMIFEKDFCQPTCRLIVAWVVLNLLPWTLFGMALYWLRGEFCPSKDWTISTPALVVVRGVLPGLVPFGSYKIWLALIQYFPSCFYAKNQNSVPKPFYVELEEEKIPKIPIEPTQQDLNLTDAGWLRNLIFGFIYLGFVAFALIPGIE